MFSQYAVLTLQKLVERFRPSIPLWHPVQLCSWIFIVLTFFLSVNRRPVEKFNLRYWKELFDLVQLFKVVFILRFLLIELVSQELNCVLKYFEPVIVNTVGKRTLSKAALCTVKVLHLATFVGFIVLNVVIAIVGEVVFIWAKQRIKDKGGLMQFVCSLFSPPVNCDFLDEPVVNVQALKRQKESTRQKYREEFIRQAYGGKAAVKKRQKVRKERRKKRNEEVIYGYLHEHIT